MKLKFFGVIAGLILTVTLGVSFVLADSTTNFHLEILGLCNDGIDNDGDGKIDFPADPGCVNIIDNTEDSEGGGGGGGGGGAPVIPTKFSLSGKAFFNQKVVLLKDAQKILETGAGTDGSFAFSLSDLSSGAYVFAVYSTDINGIRSSLVTFNVTLEKSKTTKIDGVFVSPTIALDKDEVKQGNSFVVFGQSIPNAKVLLVVSSETGEESIYEIQTSNTGLYEFTIDTANFSKGKYYIKTSSAFNGSTSSYSNTLVFNIGDVDIARQIDSGCAYYGDLNSDCKVNLIDFSIAAFWYKKTVSSEFAQKEIERLNSDQIIDLVDFSIMAYYWTG